MLQSSHPHLTIEKEGRFLSLEEFEKLTESVYLSKLDFDPKTLEKITRKCAKLHKKGYFSLEQMWLGSYFKKDLAHPHPPLAIRWTDEAIGWGVFAGADIKKMTFIAEYTGKVRKRRWEDRKNGYCFEYNLAHGVRSPYTIDAQRQGGVARFINHSAKGNLQPALITSDNLSRVVLYAAADIRKGDQLLYDYGEDYWKKRKPPKEILN